MYVTMHESSPRQRVSVIVSSLRFGQNRRALASRDPRGGYLEG